MHCWIFEHCTAFVCVCVCYCNLSATCAILEYFKHDVSFNNSIIIYHWHLFYSIVLNNVSDASAQDQIISENLLILMLIMDAHWISLTAGLSADCSWNPSIH